MASISVDGVIAPPDRSDGGGIEGGGQVMGAEWIVAAQLGLFGRGVAGEPAAISLSANSGSIRTGETDGGTDP